MKSAIKNYLLWGFSLSLAFLTLRRLRQEAELQASLDPPSGPRPSHIPMPEAAARNGNGKGPLPGCAASPMTSATTVTFNGIVVRKGGRFVLRETAGVLYPLDSAGRAWSYEGENVRVTGKLDLSTKLLHVDEIESAVA